METKSTTIENQRQEIFQLDLKLTKMRRSYTDRIHVLKEVIELYKNTANVVLKNVFILKKEFSTLLKSLM